LNTSNKKTRYRTKFKQKDDLGNLYCYNCKDYKDINLFDNNSQESNIFYRDGKDRRCKNCKNLQYKKRLLNNNSTTFEQLLNKRFLGLKDRAKRLKLEVNIDLDYLKQIWNKQEGKCALSQINMTYLSNKGRILTNLSIDRIDSKKGYIKDNIQFVCISVNQMKSDLTLDELYFFCESILKNKK
jgi:hypothetical protein